MNSSSYTRTMGITKKFSVSVTIMAVAISILGFAPAHADTLSKLTAAVNNAQSDVDLASAGLNLQKVQIQQSEDLLTKISKKSAKNLTTEEKNLIKTLPGKIAAARAQLPKLSLALAKANGILAAAIDALNKYIKDHQKTLTVNQKFELTKIVKTVSETFKKAKEEVRKNPPPESACYPITSVRC